MLFRHNTRIEFKYLPGIAARIIIEVQKKGESFFLHLFLTEKLPGGFLMVFFAVNRAEMEVSDERIRV